MARRSNKTAHVLNLIAGGDAKKEPVEETLLSDGSELSSPGDDETKTAVSAVPAADDTSAGTGTSTAASQNVSVIDMTTKDPVAELIQQQLSNEFETHSNETPTDEVSGSNSTETAASVSAPETIPESPAAASASAPETPPEPDFQYINIMEHIVKDKIIYYMRQFDVCTCDRCIADTVAITLNGLTPKYIVTDPAAVDPLISYYSNRSIVDITVEATKACAKVKENPRHS